jgi:hypothetical protein
LMLHRATASRQCCDREPARQETLFRVKAEHRDQEMRERRSRVRSFAGARTENGLQSG